MESLKKLKTIDGLQLIITSHSGYTYKIEEAFLNNNMLPNWKEKEYKVNESAPYNPFV
jgi:hypothetical protein